MDRSLLAKLWHERANVTRKTIFGQFDEALMPTAAPSHAGTSVPGMVGYDYARGGLVIVSVNPAGGRDGFTATAGDDQLYGAALKVKTSADLSAFENLNAAFVQGMPHWGPQWRIVESILAATKKQLSEIGYPYLVPYRSRGDAGSRLPSAVLENGFSTGFGEMIRALSPGHVVAVDRPSERACMRVLSEFDVGFHLTYLTRKRDAHAERASTLSALSAQF